MLSCQIARLRLCVYFIGMHVYDISPGAPARSENVIRRSHSMDSLPYFCKLDDGIGRLYLTTMPGTTMSRSIDVCQWVVACARLRSIGPLYNQQQTHATAILVPIVTITFPQP